MFGAVKLHSRHFIGLCFCLLLFIILIIISGSCYLSCATILRLSPHEIVVMREGRHARGMVVCGRARPRESGAQTCPYSQSLLTTQTRLNVGRRTT